MLGRGILPGHLWEPGMSQHPLPDVGPGRRPLWSLCSSRKKPDSPPSTPLLWQEGRSFWESSLQSALQADLGGWPQVGVCLLQQKRARLTKAGAFMTSSDPPEGLRAHFFPKSPLLPHVGSVLRCCWSLAVFCTPRGSQRGPVKLQRHPPPRGPPGSLLWGPSRGRSLFPLQE